MSTAAIAVAIAALCILAAQPRRVRRPAEDDLRAELRHRADELAKAERSLAAELEDACEVALVAIALGAEQEEPQPGGHPPP